MTAKTLGIAIVGFGFMGRTHFDSFERDPRCRVRMVIDRDEARLSHTNTATGNLQVGSLDPATDLSGVEFHSDIERALQSPGIDVICITTPTPSHCELGRRVVEAGKHLLVEKPVALDVASIHRLEAIASSHGVIAMPAHCMRFWPAWSWMHQRIRDSTYGPVVTARFVRTGAAPSWNPDFYLDSSKSGGAIVDLHIHDTDFVIHSFGIPDAVSSTGTHSHVRTEYHFNGGPTVEAIGAWLEDPDVPFTMTAEIECQEGTMSFSLGREPEVLVTRPGGVAVGHPEASVGGTGYDVQAKACIDAVLSGSGTPPVSLGDAARTGRVLDLEIESLEAGGDLRSTR